FRRGTEHSLRPDERFDALLTFFVLDGFPEAHLPGVMRRLSDHLTPEARWLFADFERPAHRPPHPGERVLLWSLYAFFGAVSRLPTRRLPSYPFEALGWCTTRIHRDGLLAGRVLCRLDAEEPHPTRPAAAPGRIASASRSGHVKSRMPTEPADDATGERMHAAGTKLPLCLSVVLTGGLVAAYFLMPGVRSFLGEWA
ncbi:MAG: hypothetical protein WBA12_15725, partial [Catalinimonas sp.]